MCDFYMITKGDQQAWGWLWVGTDIDTAVNGLRSWCREAGPWSWLVRATWDDQKRKRLIDVVGCGHIEGVLVAEYDQQFQRAAAEFILGNKVLLEEYDENGRYVGQT